MVRFVLGCFFVLLLVACNANKSIEKNVPKEETAQTEESEEAVSRENNNIKESRTRFLRDITSCFWQGELSNEDESRITSAIANNDLEGIRRILKENNPDIEHHIAGCDVLITGAEGRVALAIANNDLEKVKSIIKESSTLEYGHTLLSLWALQAGNKEMVQEIIEATPDINKVKGHYASPPIMTAVYLGRADLVQMLIEAGADVNVGDARWSAVETAVHEGYTEIVRLLLDAGADVNNAEGPLLGCTSKPEIAELLRAHGAKE